MKKIYTMIGVVAISMTSFAQSNALYNFGAGTKLMPAKLRNNVSFIKSKTSAVNSGTISMRVDPMANVFTNNPTPAVYGTDVKSFYTELFCDSLATFAYSSGLSNITTHMAGITFDPQSVSQGVGFTPLLSKNDSYTLDTLWFGGIYKRISTAAIVDTLVVDLAWGDTTTTTVFSKYAFPASNALGKFGSLITPKFSVASATSHGLQAKLSAPASNYMRYKIALHESDTAAVNMNGYYGYKLPSALTIPAGNRLAITYTFKSGMTYSLGAVAFGDATNPATINGWAPFVYAQYPQPTSTSAYLDYFNDIAAGKNMGVVMYSNQRYGQIATGYIQTTALYNQFAEGYQIDISLHATSTVGLNEMEKEGTFLGQNIPNPFNGESSVSYQLSKEANSVLFTLTDVMGRVITSEKVASSVGVHSVKVSSLAAGVYYYTLNVDGKTATKKMIAQ